MRKIAHRAHDTAGAWVREEPDMEYTTISQKRTDDKRPAHQVLGVDARGCVHHYHAAAEAISVVHPDAGRVQRHDPGRVDVDRWVDTVADQFGWTDCRYGQSLGDLAADVLGVA